MNRKVFIDSDPGIDDFVAITAALSMPEFDVVGLCSVAGNVSLENTTENIGKILELSQKTEIQFAKGAKQPLLCAPVYAEDVHGETGLGTIVLPKPSVQPVETPAAKFLYDCAKKYAGELTLIAVGPLTNVAIALLAFPQLCHLLKEIVFMGGGHALGNITQHAEFNIYADPHAAEIVLKSGIPLTMVGLDVTMEHGLCETECNHITTNTTIGRHIRHAFSDMRSSSRGFGLGDLAFPHDLIAVFCATNPQIAKWKHCSVDVCTQEGEHFGQTICDIEGVSQKSANVTVGLGLREEPYKHMLAEVLAAI